MTSGIALIAVREWLRTHFSAVLLADYEVVKAVTGVVGHCFISQKTKMLCVSRKYRLDDLPVKAGWKIVYPSCFEEIARHVIDALPRDEDSRYTLGVDPNVSMILMQSLEDTLHLHNLHPSDWVPVLMDLSHLAELKEMLGLEVRSR